VLGRYPKLSGMAATARPAVEELSAFYGLAVVVIPTHRPRIRVDRPDVVFTHREAKQRALAAEIARQSATGRPVLVGTASVEESERLVALLREQGLSCEVLNAKNDAEEAPAPPDRSPAWLTEVREGIHLVSVGGQRPLDEFHKLAIEAFARLDETIDERIVQSFDAIEIGEDGVDLERAGLGAPSSTWTYLVNDEGLSALEGVLAGSGNFAVAATAALAIGPILFVWTLLRRIAAKKRRSP